MRSHLLLLSLPDPDLIKKEIHPFPGCFELIYFRAQAGYPSVPSTRAHDVPLAIDIKASVVVDATFACFKCTLWPKRLASGLIHHSDRGTQYCSYDYQHLLDQFKMQASMSRKGNCYDNAPMERFWGSLKNELVHHQRYATRSEVISYIEEYTAIFYNCQRRYSRRGYFFARCVYTAFL